MEVRPLVLFVGDDASSPAIAATLLQRLVGERIDVRTAGAQPPEPGGRGDDILVQMGLDPAHEERLSVQALSVADHVVILGSHLDVARVAGHTYEEWDVEHDDLEAHVRRLAIDLLGGADDEPERWPGVRRALDRARVQPQLRRLADRLARLGRGGP